MSGHGDFYFKMEGVNLYFELPRWWPDANVGECFVSADIARLVSQSLETSLQPFSADEILLGLPYIKAEQAGRGQDDSS